MRQNAVGSGSRVNMIFIVYFRLIFMFQNNLLIDFLMNSQNDLLIDFLINFLIDSWTNFSNNRMLTQLPLPTAILSCLAFHKSDAFMITGQFTFNESTCCHQFASGSKSTLVLTLQSQASTKPKRDPAQESSCFNG